MLRSVVVVSLLAFGAAFPADAAPVDDLQAPGRGPRVRPHDRLSATVLLEGINRSATVRLLVDRLEALNVIVYIEMQHGIRNSLAGRMVWMTATQFARFVRISLNPELSSDLLIAALGHELQHALEVAMSPSIVDEPSLELYYRKNGMSMRSHVSGWDTQAARDVGDLVRRELAGTSVRFTAESTQPFDPQSWPIVYGRARERFTSASRD
jgi:hypothetical protein